MRLYDIPEEKRLRVEEWSLSEIMSMDDDDLENMAYFTWISDDEDEPEESRPGLITNGRKQTEAFYICGKHRYIRYGYNNDKYITIDFSNKLFDVKVDVIKGWIYTGGICMEIPNIKDFNKAVVAFIWADYIYGRNTFIPKKIECKKFVSTRTVNVPLDKKYEFTIRGALYTAYDLNYDKGTFGKGDLRFSAHRRTWYDFDQTFLRNITSNETGFVGFEVENQTLDGHHKSIYTWKSPCTDKYSLFGTRNEFAIICGDPLSKTIYVFTDNSTTACWEIIVNTLQEYNLLGTWLTKAAEEICEEYRMKYNSSIFVSHPTNITSEYGKNVNDSIYVRSAGREERVSLSSGRYMRSIEEI